MTCGCNDKCELPKALQINNPGEVTLFHRVDIPASQGDDTTYPPKNGLYRNVLLVYLANNHSYLYNSDGIPTRVDGPAGPGTAAGGETGQVLAKRSDADYDTTWVTQTSANDATLTISRNDTPVGTFTANASVDKTIDIEVPTKTSDLINDGETGESTYAEATDIADIWEEIEEIEAASDVTDVVGTYAELEDYDTSKLKDNDIIKVLEDETQNDQITYYRWDTDTETFTLIGAIGPYYTKLEADTTFQGKLTAGSNITIDANNEISATDTTYSDFTGATSSVAGAHGLVPAPTTSDPDKFLKGDGTWGTPPGTTYSEGTGIDITGSTISVDTATVAMQTDLPTKTSDLINDGSDSTSTYVEADELATVATSGSYTDLLNKPTIPTVNDATLTIQKNGTTVETFTANSSTNKTANITVPTKTSDLTNDGADNTSTYVEADELATVATSGSYTDLTNKPTIPTINRFTKSLYNSTANSWYYPIATLPIDNSGNYCSVIIDGRIGGWVDSNMAKLDLIFTNRDGYTGDTVAAAGSIKGAYSNALNLCNVVVYKQTDKSAIAYLKCDGYFTFDIEVKYFQATSAWTGNYTTSPSGTLIWSTKTTSSLEYVDQSGKISKVREVYNHFTTRPASANLTATGNGGMFTFQATGNMTTAKPKTDSHILQLEWDNTSGYDSQVAVSNTGNNPWVGIRAQQAGVWSDWTYLLNDTAGSVKTANIDALAVTTAKIADGAITETKINATDWAKKVNVANIDLTGQTITLLSLTHALGAAGTDYARWTSKTDGGSANISDKPTGSTNKSFVCEAICSRWASSSDYGYQLICRPRDYTNPYVTYIDQNTSNIVWSRLSPTVNDATLTITQNGTTAGTFTANSSTNTTIALTDTTYTAGTGIDITGNTVEVDDTVALIDDPTTSETPTPWVETSMIENDAVTPEKATFTEYSTTEQVVGTWIDGKPLYRVVLSGNISSTTGTYVPTNTYNAATVDVVSCTGKLVNDQNQYMQLGCYLNSSNYSGWFMSASAMTIFFPSAYNNGAYTIVIEYTKKTS